MSELKEAVKLAVDDIYRTFVGVTPDWTHQQVREVIARAIRRYCGVSATVNQADALLTRLIEIDGPENHWKLEAETIITKALAQGI